MKYLKTFEELDDIAFSVGDIVVCISGKKVRSAFAEVGTKFKVLRIYTYIGDTMKKKDFNHLRESQHTKDFFVEVKNLENNNNSDGIWSDRFVSETKYNEMKYNL